MDIEKGSDESGAVLNGIAVLFKITQTAMQQQAARSVDIALVVRNWLFGWYIVEFENGNTNRAELYGKALINRLSQRLKESGIRGMSPTSLRKYREFYLGYADIQQALPVTSLIERISSKDIQQMMPVECPGTGELSALIPIIDALKQHFTLGWTHYITLLMVKDNAERRFYEIETKANGWGYRELERQINTSLYERLSLSRDKEGVKELSTRGHIIETPVDIIKNPYILEFTGLETTPSYSENDLESALINRLEQFLLELGKGFLFEARQKRFAFDNRHFFVDLVFYNRLLRSYVLIDLKIGDLKHQDLGQMQMYVNYFDRHVKTDEENPTVGILLCHTKSDDLVELTLPSESNIFASSYQMYLPDKDALKKLLFEAEQDWKAHR
jgi:predicted nuclease of restriction endonuclease-like (RecB) superfamily